MTVPTTSWDENSPAGSQKINLGDNRIREMKTQVREVVGVDHKFDSSGQDADNGKHNKVSLLEQADIGAGTTGKPILGGQTDSSGSGKPELCYTDEDNTDVYLTDDGRLGNRNTDIVANTFEAQGAVTFNSTLDVDGNITTPETIDAGTLTADNVNISGGDIQADTFNLGSTNQGDVLYDNGTTITRLPPGTSGQNLQTNGPASNPSWSTPPLLFVSRTTISSSSNSGNISIEGGKRYKVVVRLDRGGSSQSVYIRVNSNSSGYSYVTRGYNQGGAASYTLTALGDSTGILVSSSQTGSLNFDFLLTTDYGDSQTFQVNGTLWDDYSGQIASAYFAGQSIVGATITDFEIASSGNLNGEVIVYEYSGF